MATDESTSRAVQASSPERPPTAAQQRATQHQGTTDTDVLVSDIEKTRQELASTIDEIVDRVSPKKVVERTKQQATEAAKQGVHDASVIAKETAGVVREKAATAGELIKEKAGTATEAVKGAAATVKDKVGGTGDAHPDSSPLAAATSVEVGSATPVGSPAGSPAAGATAGTESASVGRADADADTATYRSTRSPLPAGTVSIDAGELPPPEPLETSGSLADTAESSGTSALPLTASSASSGTAPGPSHLPPASGTPARTPTGAPSPSPVPVLAGAGVAAVVALVLLLLRRRSR